MTLDKGTRLGHYEVLEPIGAGGMGEVYKATDTRLDRTVAIKVLAAHLAESPERKERFEREARTISKLNHPNICTLYDIGSQDGTDFLVMEYIEGETLADRLTRGALSRDEALEYGIQITDALAKAHRAGIVHRDLKPANIMLTKMGVKLLDFGLAKLVEPDSGAGDSSAPTMQRDLTHERAIIGTPRYMAPEQFEGAKADARTDLYAFGLVLREMLTGKKSPAVINDPIESADIGRVLTKCLAEDPDERWQTAKDLSDELRWLASKPSPAGVPSRKPHALLLTGLLGAVVASITWWLLPGRELERRSPVHFRLQPPEGYVFRGMTPWSNPLGISPDGTHVIFRAFDSDSGERRLIIRPISEPVARVVPDIKDVAMPFFSWDGSFVAYSTGDELWRVRLSGGAPEKISDVPMLKSGAAWGSDDTIVFSSLPGLLKVSPNGGSPEQLSSSEQRWPQFLPDGKTLLVTIQTSAGFRPALLSMATGKSRVLEELGLGRGARYLTSGHIVLAEGNHLFAAAFDLPRLQVSSRPVPVLEGIFVQPDSGLAWFTTSDRGDLVYLNDSGWSADRRLVLVDRRGDASAPFEERGYFVTARYSPDGQKIAVSRGDQDSARNMSIWIHDVATGVRNRLTTGHLDDEAIWAPDGGRVVFGRRNRSILSKSVGDDVEDELYSHNLPTYVGSWTPDGSALAYYQVNSETQGDIWILDSEGGTEPWLVIDSWEKDPKFSPDGRWLAYASDETGRYEIYVRPYPGPGDKVPISSDGGRDPVWSPDGSELFYRNGRAVMVAAVVETEPSFRAGRPEQLFTGPYATSEDSGSLVGGQYDIAPDGEHFLMIENTVQSEAELHVILNWGEELKRLVPPDH